jgi:hypothetical protein
MPFHGFFFGGGAGEEEEEGEYIQNRARARGEEESN